MSVNPPSVVPGDLPGQEDGISTGDSASEADDDNAVEEWSITPMDELGAELEQLFSLIAHFAAMHLKHDGKGPGNCNVNSSNPLNDPQLPRFVKAMLITSCVGSGSSSSVGGNRTTTTTTTTSNGRGGGTKSHSLLSDVQGRAQVYAQFLSMLIQSTVLTVDAFRGFDDGLDEAVRDAHSRCYELMEPATRFAILTRVAGLFRRTTVARARAADFAAFLERRAVEHSESIATFIRPLLSGAGAGAGRGTRTRVRARAGAITRTTIGSHSNSNGNNRARAVPLPAPMRSDLQSLMRKAYAVSHKLHCHPVRYLYTYFEANRAFQQAEMALWAATATTVPSGGGGGGGSHNTNTSSANTSPIKSSPLTVSALEQERYLVVVTATPRVEMRTYTHNGLISTRTITKAVVAARKPRPPPPPPPPSPSRRAAVVRDQGQADDQDK